MSIQSLRGNKTILSKESVLAAAILSKNFEVAEVASNEPFLVSLNGDSMVRSFAKITLIDNLGVGQVTVAGANCNLIVFVPKTATKAIMLELGVDMKTVKSNAGVKYVGLQAQIAKEIGYETDDKTALVTIVDDSMVDGLMDQMRKCDLLDEENLKKIFKDVDCLYRMYQEMTIDSAKKVFIVKIKFMITSYRAKSIRKFKKNFNYDEKIYEFNKTFPERKDERTGQMIKYYSDPFHKMQTIAIEFLKVTLESLDKAEIGMPAEEKKRLKAFTNFGPYADLMSICKSAYGIITAKKSRDIETYSSKFSFDSTVNPTDIDEDDFIKEIKAICNADLDRIKNLVRQLTAEISAYQRASLVQCVAKSKDNVLDPKSSNMMATSLLPQEFLTMVRDTTSLIKVMGYKIVRNAGLVIGSKVEFENGVSVTCGSTLDFQNEMAFATGEFDITELNGELYATKPLEFHIEEADFTKRLFVVKPNSYKSLKVLKTIIEEGRVVLVDDMGQIVSNEKTIAEVKYSDKAVKKGQGIGMKDLLGVKGLVTNVTVIDNTDPSKAPFFMFELSNIEELPKAVEQEIDDSDLYDNNTSYSAETDSEDGLPDPEDDIEDDIIDVEEDDVDDLLDGLLDEEIEL